jgi:uncharacterized protein YwlG (UPF0340 family)
VFLLPGNKESCECVLTITNKKCALLKMAASEAAGSRFARVDEEEISQIIEDAIPKSTKRQTSWSVATLEVSKPSKNLYYSPFFRV